MKRKLLLIIVMFFSITNLTAQTITEGFEGSFPPEGWTISGAWTQNSSSFQGTHSAYVTDGGSTDSRMTLPIYNVQTGTVLSFQMACNFASWADQTIFTIETSPSIGADSLWTVVDTIYYPGVNFNWESRTIEFTEYSGEELYISFHVVNDNGASTLIDQVVLTTITCPAVRNLSVYSIATTSAELSFEDNASSGDYLIQLTQVISDTISVVDTITSSSTNITLDNLQASTMYKVKVKSICEEDDTSEWSEEITFVTLCTDLITELPWTFDFEGLSYLTCWTPIQTSENNGVTYPSLNQSSISGNTMMLRYGENLVIAPLVLENINNLRLQFFAEKSSYYGSCTLLVGLVSDDNNIESFIPVDTINVSDDERIFIVDFDDVALEGLDYRIAFKSSCNEYDNIGIYIDDVTINTIPTCPSPEKESVEVTVNAETATVTWTDLDEEHNAWIVYYKEESGEEYYSVNATEQSVVLTNLTPETTYLVYVMTNCGTSDNTDQTLTTSFTTTPLSTTIPYFEDFDSGAEITDIIFIQETGTNRWIVGDSTGYSQTTLNEEGRSMYISSDSSNYNYAVSSNSSLSFAYIQVELNNPELEYNLSFDYKVPGGESNFDYLSVYILDPTVPINSDIVYNNNLTTILLKKSYTTNWTNVNYVFPSEMVGSTKRIVFVWKNDFSSGTNPPAAIDNIHIYGTTCLTPANISLTEITSNSATINWTGSADEYIINYQLLGDTIINTVTVSDTTYTINDLETASTYSFTIQSSCGEEVSSVSESMTFNTLCGAIDTPIWFEDFESALSNEEEANNIMRCWSVLRTHQFWNGTFPRIYHEGYAPAAHSGSVTMEFKGAQNMLVLPEFAADVNTLQFSFYANTTASSASGAGFMEVGILTDINDTASFIILDTVTPVGFQRNGSHLVSFEFSSLTQTEGRITLRYTNMSNPSESWNLDDFQVAVIPDCPSPEKDSVTVSDIGETTATISWVDNDLSHTSWLVYYKHINDTEYTEVSATQQSITLTDLIHSSQYSVYVMTDCGTEDNVDRTNIVTFTTATTPISTFPYYQDFEDAVNNPASIDLRSDCVNKWTIGTATGMLSAEDESAVTTSLYISNDNGTSYAYSLNITSHSYAIMYINFGENSEYTLEFDYKVPGEKSGYIIYDYLQVFLCDANQEIPTSGAPQGTLLLNETAGINAWAHFTTSISNVAQQNKKIVFYWKNDGAGGTGIPAVIDNIAITGLTCSSPTELTATDIEAEQVNLTWNDYNNSSSWTIYYKRNIDTVYNSIEVNTNPYTLTDIIPSSEYTIYVVSNCEDTISNPSNTITFFTDCPGVVEDYPYFESFEVAEGSCWQIQNITGSNNWYYASSYNANSTIFPTDGQKMVYYAYNASHSGRITSPVFDLSEINTPYLKFDYILGNYNNFSETLTIQYRTAENEEWTNLISYTEGSNQWITDSVALESSSEYYQISFVAVGNNGWGVGLDAVYVYNPFDEGDEEPDPCDAPTNLVANNITETTADIAWEGTAETYEFKLNGGEVETLTATTKSLTDLTANTTYTVEVRAICGEQQSTWTTTTFTTLEATTPEPEIVAGEVTTQPATEVGNTSATLNGALVSAGNSENYTLGFALATIADFTLETEGVQNITATATDATFSQAVNDLAEGQTYFYRAYITNEAGTAYGTVETFTLSGLNDATANGLQAVVYPNPANTQATLQINGLTSDAKIIISDLQGRILSEGTMEANTTSYTIDLSKMASGVYYIRIVADQAISTQKLIVE